MKYKYCTSLGELAAAIKRGDRIETKEKGGIWEKWDRHNWFACNLYRCCLPKPVVEPYTHRVPTNMFWTQEQNEVFTNSPQHGYCGCKVCRDYWGVHMNHPWAAEVFRPYDPNDERTF